MTHTTTYAVTAKKQFPAWDEHDGVFVGDFRARSKSEAIQMARSHARAYGYFLSEGRYWLRASVADGQRSFDDVSID